MTMLEELRYAAKWLKKIAAQGNSVTFQGESADIWARMLERAADRIEELEAQLERLVA